MWLRELLCRHQWGVWDRWPLNDAGDDPHADIQRVVDVAVGGTLEQRTCLKCRKVDVRVVD